MGRGQVVVGIDGTQGSLEALRWAASLSRETTGPLVVVHTYRTGPLPRERSDDFRAAMESWHRVEATGWLHRALEDAPDVPSPTRLVVREGDWVEGLLSEAGDDAEALVVGLTGESARQVATRAAELPCPVVLVPPRRVVSTRGSSEALALATDGGAHHVGA